DVHLLGHGARGHINSLFPHSPAVLESTRVLGGAPNFDVHLLGHGARGHINSLFPHSPAVLESTRVLGGA
ncbi:hypothetical protein GR254_25190, partial [Mycobacterium tuberculosis]|nr:hypothetical protein [Mycobacterium tuberculosis]